MHHGAKSNKRWGVLRRLGRVPCQRRRCGLEGAARPPASLPPVLGPSGRDARRRCQSPASRYFDGAAEPVVSAPPRGALSSAETLRQPQSSAPAAQGMSCPIVAMAIAERAPLAAQHLSGADLSVDAQAVPASGSGCAHAWPAGDWGPSWHALCRASNILDLVLRVDFGSGAELPDTDVSKSSAIGRIIIKGGLLRPATRENT